MNDRIKQEHFYIYDKNDHYYAQLQFIPILKKIRDNIFSLVKNSNLKFFNYQMIYTKKNQEIKSHFSQSKKLLNSKVLFNIYKA